MSGFIGDGDPIGQMPFGDTLEKGIVDFNKNVGKKVAADITSRTYNALSKATEPIFRRNMGERYFTSAALSSSEALWFAAGLASCATGSLPGWVCRLMGMDQLVVLLCHFGIPALTGIAFLYYYSRFGKESLQSMAEYRSEGKTYHSKSRGVPRWEESKDRSIRIRVSLALLLLAPVMGVAFIISLGISASLEQKQQTALHDRYLDMLDQQIEGELLQDALLGKCPPEVTFLYKPLSEKLSPELRENIAAAAVGKPVKIMARKAKAPAERPVSNQLKSDTAI